MKDLCKHDDLLIFNQIKAKDLILEFTVYLLVALFLLTAVSKLMDLDKFTWQINNQVLDNRFTPYLVYGLPAAELLLAILLPWPKTRLIALYGSALMMTVFTVYIGLVTFKVFDRVPCGCATAFEHLTWPQHLIMNATITLLSFVAIYIETNRKINTNRKTA